MNKGMMCGGRGQIPLWGKMSPRGKSMQNTWEWYPKKEITSLIGEGIIQPTTLTFSREEVKSRVSIFSPFQHCVDEYSGHAP